MKILTTAFLLLLAQTETAFANQYVRTWTDYTDARTGFKLERIYNSRSLTNGSFGFGWCSDLETRIEITRDGRVKLLNCTEQKEITFTPTPEKARRAGVPDRQPSAFSPRDGTTFLSKENLGEWVELKNGIYTKFKNGSPQALFDSAGRLLEWTSAEGVKNRIKRNVGGDPITWETDRGLRLSLRSEPGTGRITQVLLPGGRAISYRYNDQNLIGTDNSRSMDWIYQYDDLHNLTRSQSSDGFVESVTYDKLHDEMIRVQRGLQKEIR